MNNDTANLEKTIKEQAKQIASLKKAVVDMNRQLMALTKKTNRTYENARKNTIDINTLTGILRRNG